MPHLRRFTLLAALVAGITAAPSDGHAVDPDKTVTAESVTAARKSLDKVSTLVENLQDDIVEELAGEKEKTLFRLADQAQSELELLDQALGAKSPAREALYKRFDLADSKVAALLQAVSDLSPKRPALVRQTERLRTQTDDLHFVLSTGDGTAERLRQVLGRQAKSMKFAAKQFVLAAEYALLDRPGRALFLDAVKKFAEKCEVFEKTTAGGDLDATQKEFSLLTDSWAQVVNGFLKLSPKEDYHIARQAFRLDTYHRQLFELLKMPGKRPALSINL